MQIRRSRQLLACMGAAALLAMPLASWASFEQAEKAYVSNEHYAAFLAFVPLAKEGNAAAQAMVAKSYYLGTGAPPDARAAADWYLRAATQGHATAQYELARLLAAGVGVPQDSKRAAEWMEKSAEQGVPWAMQAIGIMYRDGNGVAKDAVQAYKWLSLAATQPETPATAETIKLARDARAELDKSMSADGVQQAGKLATTWSARKIARDTEWSKAINAPNAPRTFAAKPAEPVDAKQPRAKNFSDGYFPKN